MKRLFIFLLALSLIGVLGIGKTYAAEVTIVSDTETKYFNGVEYVNSVATWKHPSWPTVDGATWIWNSLYTAFPTTGETVEFQRMFNIPGIPISGDIEMMTADNEFTGYLNTNLFGSDNAWATTHSYELDDLQQGENTLEFSVINWEYPTTNPQVNPGGLVY